MTNPLYDALFAPHEGQGTVFLHLADGGRLTHAEFLSKARRTANALTAMGVAPGDRVAVHVEKSPGALALYAACVMAGVVFLPLNTAYTAKELDYFVGDSGAALFVCDPAEAGAMAPIAEAAGAKLLTLGAMARARSAMPWRGRGMRSSPSPATRMTWRRCSTLRAPRGARRARC